MKGTIDKWGKKKNLYFFSLKSHIITWSLWTDCILTSIWPLGVIIDGGVADGEHTPLVVV